MWNLINHARSFRSPARGCLCASKAPFRLLSSSSPAVHSTPGESAPAASLSGPAPPSPTPARLPRRSRAARWHAAAGADRPALPGADPARQHPQAWPCTWPLGGGGGRGPSVPGQCWKSAPRWPPASLWSLPPHNGSNPARAVGFPRWPQPQWTTRPINWAVPVQKRGGGCVVPHLPSTRMAGGGGRPAHDAHRRRRPRLLHQHAPP